MKFAMERRLALKGILSLYQASKPEPKSVLSFPFSIYAGNLANSLFSMDGSFLRNGMSTRGRVQRVKNITEKMILNFLLILSSFL